MGLLRVVNLRLEKLGRFGPGRYGPKFQVDWAGPGRYGQKFSWAGPRIYNPRTPVFHPTPWGLNL